MIKKKFRNPFDISIRAAVLLLFMFQIFPNCKSGDIKGSSDSSVSTDILEDDSFFTAPALNGEAFRVLITEEGYFYKNVSDGGKIERKPDPGGDSEQFRKFKKYNDEYDFKDWTLTAILKVRLNPHRGELEHIEYFQGHNPKTWQSGNLFQEDLSRFDFVFPENEITVFEFLVSYEWRIKKRSGLSEEEARRRAIEYLNSQVRGR
ncbi:MAG: hypothetical protein OEZ34_10210 [Spirochaetia bacterium]|nr:hypothetical protein [Spirochaetia bacterium]